MHVERVQAVWPFGPGVVEGMDHHRDALVPIGNVELRPADVVADRQSDPDTADISHHQAIAHRIVFLVAARAEAFVVAVNNPAFRVNQVKAIGRFRLVIEKVG